MILWTLLLLLLFSCSPQSNHSRTLSSEQVSCASGGLPKGIVRAEDFLAFPNFGYRGIGRCRGHAIVSQKLVLMLRFAPANKRKWDCAVDVENCRKIIGKILTNVDQGNVETVDGFSNLAELSADPVVEAILRSRIIAIGNRYSANATPLSGLGRRSVLVLKEALRRVRLNQIPYLALNGVEVGDHAVLAYGEAERDNLKVLCVRDPNIVPLQGREECENYLFQDGERVRYVRRDFPEDLVNVQLTEDEDRRASAFQKVLCSI